MSRRDDPDFRAADWEMAPGTEPCSVYPETADTPGHIATPLGDVQFFNLHGDPVEMMRTLGRRSTPELERGAISFVERHLCELTDQLAPSLLSGPGNWLLRSRVIDPLERNIPDDHLRMLRAYAEETNLETERAVTAQLFWETRASLLRAPLERIRQCALRTRTHSLFFDSFSLVANIEQNRPLHVRWLDNAATDAWDRSTSVAFFHPDRGIPYALVSSLGFCAGVPAGMNRAGLSVSVELSGAEQTGDGGTICALAIHDVLRRAHTIEEAVSILRQCSLQLPWRWVICEGDTGRAQVFDVGETVERFEVDDDSRFWLGGAKVDLPEKTPERIARWKTRRRQRLDKFTGRWTPPANDAVYDALERLGDSDGCGFGLAEISNVGAVVFEPKHRRLWVATGRAPVCKRWFVPMAFPPDGGIEQGGLDGRVRPLKPDVDFEETDAGQAVEHLRRARRLWLGGESPERVLIVVEHALALHSELSFYQVLTGLTALEAERYRRAEGAFRKAIDMIDDPTRRCEVEVYLGWALDLQNRRKEARRIYARITKSPEVEMTVRRWARNGKRRRFRGSDFEELEIDFFLATVFE